MKNIYLLVFAVFGLLLVSCKDKDKDPKPTVGSIRCAVTPAGSVSAMSVTAGGTIYTALPEADNSFLIGNLPPGQYTVSFQTTPNYREPAKRLAEITANNETNLGTISIEKVIDTGTFSATLNGNSWVSPLPLGTINNNSLIVTGTQINLNGNSEVITLVLPNFNGTGIYTGPVDASATFTSVSISGNMQNWSTSTGQCLVNISRLDPNEKQVSGTFSFLAIPADPNASGTKTVTNGTFSNVSFQ
ncbi:DUF6252 family protein [Adhaeribacter terreus]|uniref:DUF6252 family protein n=1 Tax=Adhaeribacter terreus TaxID=529703 RepID=A0ABW0E9L8_9BACT